MPSVPHSSALILRWARQLRSPDPELSRGLCFGLTVALAERARQRGLALTLIRWHVPDSPDFHDHWAVRWGPDHALDLSSAQFDPRAPLIIPLHRYPAGYIDRREYPAELLLQGLEGALWRGRHRGLFPLGWRLQVHWRLWRHDMQTRETAWKQRLKLTWQHIAGSLGICAQQWHHQLTLRVNQLEGRRPTSRNRFRHTA